jgi:signal transduction histidine kinase/CheY-like chemotaxis protein
VSRRKPDRIAGLLREVGRAANEAGGVDELLRYLAERIREAEPCEAAIIVVAAEDAEDRFRLAAASTAVPAILGLSGRFFRRAGSLVERALRDGTQHVQSGAGLEPGTVMEALGRASVLKQAVVAPFRTPGLEEGALILLNPQEPADVVVAAETGAALTGLALGAVSRVPPGAIPDISAYGEEAAARLARTHRLAALGELAAGVAHDLNNALNPIVAFAELLAAEAHNPEQVRLYASRILLAATDGAETVRRIQGFTRRRGTTRPAEVVGLATAAREALELSRPTWAERQQGGRVEALLSVDPDLRVRASPSEIREVLLNLINNSLDAMPAGGTLRLLGRKEGDIAVLAVEDSGAGMTAEVRDRAFEPFFTTKGQRGTGLGLSEVQSIVRRHGGRIELESEPGIGTTVRLKFRAVTDEEPAEAATPRRGPTGKPMRILLVDDNVLNAEALAAALRNAGHVVSTAESGEVAVEQFQRNRYGMAIVDIGLPGMNGFELVDALRRIDPLVPVGIVTGWALEEDSAEIAKRGVAFILTKPVSSQELLSVI